MSSDPHDELARRRNERHRDRRTPAREVADDPNRSAEQDAAIARARESWLLSRVRPDKDGESDTVLPD
jgi:hypothetical protein